MSFFKKQNQTQKISHILGLDCLPSRRSSGIISFTASRIPLCLASWPSSSLAQALQHPHTAQPDSPEPHPQILWGGGVAAGEEEY